MNGCELSTMQDYRTGDAGALRQIETLATSLPAAFYVTRVQTAYPSLNGKPSSPPDQESALSAARSAEWLLVQRAASGDAEAREQLFQMYFAKLFRAAYKLLQNKEDAEDVAQQACVKALLHLQQFQGKAAFSTWLTQIAVNETIVMLRRRRTTRELPVLELTINDDEPFVLDMPDEKNPNPEEYCFQQECAELLSTAVSRLKPRLREAIVVQEHNELSPKEIAKHLGITVTAAKSRVFQGRRRMRQVLERALTRRPRSNAPGKIRSEVACASN